MEQQKTRMSMDQIPFDKLEKVGINRDLIQKMETYSLLLAPDVDE